MLCPGPRLSLKQDKQKQLAWGPPVLGRAAQFQQQGCACPAEEPCAAIQAGQKLCLSLLLLAKARVQLELTGSLGQSVRVALSLLLWHANILHPRITGQVF